MKIVVSCLQSLKKHRIPSCDFWWPYFLQGSKEAGLDVLEVPGVDWAEGLTFNDNLHGLLKWRSETWEKTLKFIRHQQARGSINYFLSYFYPCQIEEAAIREIQRIGIPCVNFFCDNVREFHHVPKAFREFSLNWVPEFEALPMYREARLKHIHLPMPCWLEPKWRSMPSMKSEGSCTFIGSEDILRRELLANAISLGANLIIRGPGWKKNESQLGGVKRKKNTSLILNQIAFLRKIGFRGLLAKIIDKAWRIEPKPIDPQKIFDPVFGSDYFFATRTAQVTIGINRVPASRRPLRFPLSYSRLRDIEAPMLGACYLTEWTHGLDKLYELGTEIECYRSPEELSEKLKMLAGNFQLRFKLRRLGQRRALQDHSVAASLRKIASFLEGRLP